MKFYQFGDVFACESCTTKEIKKSEDGTYTGDEKVDKVTFAGTHGQCDICQEQCDDYPDCENK